MATKKLPGAPFPPGTVFPHGRMPASGPILGNVPSIVQAGYDQTLETIIVPPPSGLIGFMPRDAAGNPIKVVFPEVVPGDVLEVDWRANGLVNLDEYYPTQGEILISAVATFDGTDPSVTNVFFGLQNSWSVVGMVDNAGDEGTSFFSNSALCAIVIPDDAKSATVELIYTSNVDFDLSGAEKKEPGGGVTLKVTEIARGVVTQVGPGNLVHFP